MLILIAESKSMSHMCSQAAPADGTVPQFVSEADAVMAGLRGMSAADIGKLLRLGPKNAVRLCEDIYSFPDKTTGCRAGEAFTGVVFKALDTPSLDAAAHGRFDRDVRIVSSLYGLLRPSDVIRPYRLDFGMKAAPGGGSLTAYWKPLLTAALTAQLEREGESEVLALLPLDAYKCFDWKEIGKAATVCTAAFRQVCDGVEKAPSSDMLKRLRGRLLRHILQHGITTCSGLLGRDLGDMICEEADDGRLVFTTA